MNSLNGQPAKRIRLCRIVTVPLTFSTLLRQQVLQIAAAGIDLTLVCGPGEEFGEISESLPVPIRRIPFVRKPLLMQDIKSLACLIGLFYRGHFDIVHSSTPKAGFLTAIAGWLTRTPVRIHTYTGQVWIGLKGPLWWVLKISDRIIGLLNTNLFADSASQRDFLISQNLVRRDKIAVLGAGSISGVDLKKYSPGLKELNRKAIRAGFEIAESAMVIIFVGRVTKDKGIVELVEAFDFLQKSNSDLHLMLVGPFEPDRDPLPPNVVEKIKTDSRIHVKGFAANPEEYLAGSDIFCLPSYREGFGSVVIEAGAMGLPTVATRVTGLIDAVQDEKTGLLVPAQDTVALIGALQKLIDSPRLRNEMGVAARTRVVREFDSTLINKMVVEEYFRIAHRSNPVT